MDALDRNNVSFIFLLIRVSILTTIGNIPKIELIVDSNNLLYPLIYKPNSPNYFSYYQMDHNLNVLQSKMISFGDTS